MKLFMIRVWSTSHGYIMLVLYLRAKPLLPVTNEVPHVSQMLLYHTPIYSSSINAITQSDNYYSIGIVIFNREAMHFWWVQSLDTAFNCLKTIAVFIHRLFLLIFLLLMINSLIRCKKALLFPYKTFCVFFLPLCLILSLNFKNV